MADKPVNMNRNASLIAAQSPPQANLAVSFESSLVTLAGGEKLNVEGVAFVFAYGGGVCTAFSDPSATASGALFTPGGVAVNVTGAQLIDVRGVAYISFASASKVVCTG